MIDYEGEMAEYYHFIHGFVKWYFKFAVERGEKIARGKLDEGSEQFFEMQFKQLTDNLLEVLEYAKREIAEKSPAYWLIKTARYIRDLKANNSILGDWYNSEIAAKRRFIQEMLDANRPTA